MKFHPLSRIKKHPSLKGSQLRLALFVLISLLIALQSFAFSLYFREITNRNLLSNAQVNLQSTLESSVRLLDFQLESLLDRVIVFTTDSSVYDIISSPGISSYERLQKKSELEQLVQRYFVEFEFLSSVVIVSPELNTRYGHYSVPDYQSLLSLEDFRPDIRYPFSQWLSGNDLSPRPADQCGLLVRQLNLTKYDKDVIKPLSREIEAHYLVVSLNAELYRTTLGNSLLYDGAQYCVMDPSGRVVTSSNGDAFALYQSGVMPEDGPVILQTDGNHEILACQTTSRITGWKAVICVPVKELTSGVRLRGSYLFLFLLFLSLSTIALASISIGVLMRPMKALIEGISQIGEGRFDTVISIENSGDFKLLSTAINDMSARLKRLISENYEIRLKEQQARIETLELQINPHLIYNTLNTITYMVERGDKACAHKMINSLSSLLRYAANRENVEITFQEDLDWVRHYLYIMSIRFPGRYTVYYHIEPEMYACRIPKLILQPLLENSILHGLSEKEFGGVIDISASRQGNTAIFCVRDNGKGMLPETLSTLLHYETSHIGCRNVHHRLQLMYGSEYGLEVSSVIGEYTQITARLPYHTAMVPVWE